jgi:hypothetical protein
MVETLCAALTHILGLEQQSGGAKKLLLVVDGKSIRGARCIGDLSVSVGRGPELTVVLTGFPNTLQEALLLEARIGRPDAVVCFTGETEFLKRALSRELEAKGRVRERARSFGEAFSMGGKEEGNSGGLAGARKERRRTVGVGDRSREGPGGTTLGDFLQFVRGRRGAEVAVEQVGDGEKEVAEGDEVGEVEREVERQFPERWHLPLLEVSSRYTAELGPRAVAIVDVQAGKEAIYVEVVKVVQNLFSEV